MKKLTVEDRAQIKQLLYAECVLAVKNDRYRSFGGFQLWWYNRQKDVCSSCESTWSDPRKRIRHHSLDGAAKALWQRRNTLFLRSKHVSEDSLVEKLEHLAK
ncbi:MAG: hypothetical protein JSU94_01540 [Phycisphaerales bacterium]|nr:MAG: hypothetical protein JSU94_01540 [Phycisphaerales bacterium]